MVERINGSPSVETKKAPVHNPQPQPNTQAEKARAIELLQGGLPPIQKSLGR